MIKAFSRHMSIKKKHTGMLIESLFENAFVKKRASVFYFKINSMIRKYNIRLLPCSIRKIRKCSHFTFYKKRHCK